MKRISRRHAVSILIPVLLCLSVLGWNQLTTTHAAPVGPTTRTSRVCSKAPVGYLHCNALLISTIATNGSVQPHASAPIGYVPADLQAAYHLPSATAGKGQTIAIVDAYDDPKAESDLAIYRARFGLSACTTANGCFKKVNQTGGTKYPAANTGWAEEISLDLDMASAVCPKCHILLVEADSPTLINLGTAVNTAARLGATTISNSYGGTEFAAENVAETLYYNHPGIAITVSSGDSGYGAEFPASSRYVTAVGGTTLKRSGATWTETVWKGAGSGCSAYITKPTWQKDTQCKKRTVADVSAVADPATGVAVYDSYGVAGWLRFGGTSVSAPIIAGVYALAGNSKTITYGSFPYSHTNKLNDVKSGSNGSCGGSYLCTAKPGYDGPSGLGTPNGSGAF